MSGTGHDAGFKIKTLLIPEDDFKMYRITIGHAT